MSWRLVSAALVALTFTSQGLASSAAQNRHWKRQTSASASDYLPRPSPDYVGWSYVHHSPGRWVYFGPSYTLVPGRGIIDEGCNLPSSACPNSQRANY